MRILLIEDERKVADFVARGLRAERFAVDIAHDGVSGWDFACTVDYDLIILDLMLPGLSGTELLCRPPATRDHVLRVADLELNRLTQQVRRSGKRIELTAKEYSLLEYLASHAGRVL